MLAEEREQICTMMATEAVQALSDFANSGFAPPSDFIDAFMREHRTTQQGMFRLLMELVEHYAHMPDRDFDGRNEAAVMLSREIVKQVPHRHLPNI